MIHALSHRGRVKGKDFKIPRDSQLINYLRTLDAVAEGTGNKEIAAVLIPHIENNLESGYLANKRIVNWRKSALSMAESGYFKVAIRDEENRPRVK